MKHKWFIICAVLVLGLVTTPSVQAANEEADKQLLEAVGKGNMAIVREALDDGANVAAEGALQLTSLHFASFLGHTEMVKLLIKQGANVEAESFFGTPLILATTTEIAELLLEQGANVNTGRGHLNLTPLHLAVVKGRKMVEFLIEHGANVNAISKEGTTPLSVATKTGNTEIAYLLLDAGADASIAKVSGVAQLEDKQEVVYLIKAWIRDQMPMSAMVDKWELIKKQQL